MRSVHWCPYYINGFIRYLHYYISNEIFFSFNDFKTFWKAFYEVIKKRGGGIGKRGREREEYRGTIWGQILGKREAKKFVFLIIYFWETLLNWAWKGFKVLATEHSRRIYPTSFLGTLYRLVNPYEKSSYF